MAEKKLAPPPPKLKTDWVPIAAVAGGAGAIGLGLFFFLKGKGASPGDTIRCRFAYRYWGEVPATYAFQISFGHVRIMEPWFDHIEGLTKWDEVEVSENGDGIYDLDFELPEAMDKGTYDAEAIIREVDVTDIFGDYYIKDVDKGVLKVEE